MNLLTHWSYAKALSCDLLLHTQLQETSGLGDHWFFFLKARAIKGALFGYGYDIVLYMDWDAWMTPRAAVPVEALLLQWPGKALYVQTYADLPNAGAAPADTSALTDSLPG